MLPKLTIRIYGDPCLRKKSAEVKAIGPGERLFIKALMAAMYEHKGVGLAAPQVGVNQQIFVADIGDGTGPAAYINPKILKKSGSQKMEEGCLSIPGVTVPVKRPQKVLVKYTDEHNQIVETELTDLLARVFQHESDHLHGKLIIDYAGITQKAKIRKQLNEIRRSQASQDLAKTDEIKKQVK